MKSLNIGSLSIGIGVPKIFVPIMETQEEGILEAARRIVASPADAVEFRLDAWEKFGDTEAHAAIIGKVKAILGPLPLLVTVRTAFEGGLAKISEQAYRRIFMALIENGGIDMIDGEEARCDDAMIKAAHEAGIGLILSYHDFRKTPSEKMMTETLMRMEKRGADIAKIAVMPSGREDISTILRASRVARSKLSIPRLIIGMGPEGLLTRVAGEALGFCLTFATCGNESAPGQIDSRLMKQYLAGIHRIRQTDRLIYLVGFMGCGKSAIGRALGRMTGQVVCEMDAMIEEAAGCTIKAMFASQGEEAFRKLETETLANISREKGGIVSTGGGVPCRRENVNLMKHSGIVVYLSAKQRSIRKRLANQIDQRPLLQGEDSEQRIEALMTLRKPLYEGAADMVVETDDKTVNAIALEIILMVEKNAEMV